MTSTAVIVDQSPAGGGAARRCGCFVLTEQMHTHTRTAPYFNSVRAMPGHSTGCFCRQQAMRSNNLPRPKCQGGCREAGGDQANSQLPACHTHCTRLLDGTIRKPAFTFDISFIFTIILLPASLSTPPFRSLRPGCVQIAKTHLHARAIRSVLSVARATCATYDVHT